MPSWAWILDTALKLLVSTVVVSLVVIIVYAVVVSLAKGGK